MSEYHIKIHVDRRTTWFSYLYLKRVLIATANDFMSRRNERAGLHFRFVTQIIYGASGICTMMGEKKIHNKNLHGYFIRIVRVSFVRIHLGKCYSILIVAVYILVRIHIF